MPPWSEASAAPTRTSHQIGIDPPHPQPFSRQGRREQVTLNGIFQQKRNVPDILVCMDEETTECARQAILDFNLAGKVKIIGYYTSEDILAAVEKGVISVTCDVDTTQLGQYSVEAVTSYIEDGRTNSFYNVDINFLDRTAVKKMRREAVTDEKDPLE